MVYLAQATADFILTMFPNFPSLGVTPHKLLTSSSTATSAGTAHLLFGAYDGLSQLNNSEVVLVYVAASAGGVYSIQGNNLGLVSQGLMIAPATTGEPAYFLMQMRAGDASGLHFFRFTTNNGIADWSVFRRLP